MADAPPAAAPIKAGVAVFSGNMFRFTHNHPHEGQYVFLRWGFEASVP